MKLSASLVSLFLPALLMLAGCASKAEFKGQPPAPTVEITEATPTSADIYTEYPAQTYARNMVDAQKGSLETAQLNLQYGTIVAPISGLIGDTLVPVGGLVTPNAAQPLTTIVPLDPIWVRFKVSEAQFLALKGRPAKDASALELILADNSRFPHTGKITNTLNQLDPRTGPLEVQAEFPNPQHQLLPGQFGRVRYVAEHRSGVILIPQRAVQQNQSVQTVFTVGPGNVVQARAVKTGPRVGENWLIEQGLQPGDRVIVEGLLSARPGAAVNPVPYQEKPAPGAAKS